MKEKITLNESVKEAIEMSLIKLIQSKSIEKITITELTAVAGVGRSSFYRNFKSFEDVAVGYVNRIYREYFRKNPIKPNKYKKEYFLSFLKERFKFIRENKELFSALHKNGMLYNVLMKMDPEIKRQYLIADISESEYFSAMIMGFSAGVIDEWVAGGLKETEEEMAKITKACLMGMYSCFKNIF